MDISIVNTCQKTYTPDPEWVIRKIIERIPAKFLSGLHEVRLIEHEQESLARYVAKNTVHTQQEAVPRIDVSLSGLRREQKISALLLNIVFIHALVEHILVIIQPTSHDEEILAVRRSRIPSYDWLYVGWWTGILVGLLKLWQYASLRRLAHQVGVLVYRLGAWWASTLPCPRVVRKYLARYAWWEGHRLYEQQRYREAFQLIKPVADDELLDPACIGSCQYLIGYLYFYGKGVVRNNAFAQKYFKKAAKNGNREALKYVKRR